MRNLLFVLLQRIESSGWQLRGVRSTKFHSVKRVKWGASNECFALLRFFFVSFSKAVTSLLHIYEAYQEILKERKKWSDRSRKQQIPCKILTFSSNICWNIDLKLHFRQSNEKSNSIKYHTCRFWIEQQKKFYILSVWITLRANLSTIKVQRQQKKKDLPMCIY